LLGNGGDGVDGIERAGVTQGFDDRPPEEVFASPDVAIQQPLHSSVAAVRGQLEAMHPMGRLATPEEIAAAVVFLCAPAASFVTGHALAADGGFLAQ